MPLAKLVGEIDGIDLGVQQDLAGRPVQLIQHFENALVASADRPGSGACYRTEGARCAAERSAQARAAPAPVPLRHGIAHSRRQLRWRRSRHCAVSHRGACAE